MHTDTKNEQQYIKMTTTPVGRLISSLAIPTIISMLVTAVYNMADTYFVSQIGSISLTASGITAPGISSRYSPFYWGSLRPSVFTAISSTWKRCIGGSSSSWRRSSCCLWWAFCLSGSIRWPMCWCPLSAPCRCRPSARYAAMLTPAPCASATCAAERRPCASISTPVTGRCCIRR